MKDIFAGNQVIHKMSDRYGWKEGSAEKTVLHGALGALTGKMSGGNALSGSVSGSVNEFALGYLERTKGKEWIIEHPDLVQAMSSVLGSVIGTATEDINTGRYVAQTGTKWNLFGLEVTKDEQEQNEKMLRSMGTRIGEIMTGNDREYIKEKFSESALDGVTALAEWTKSHYSEIMIDKTFKGELRLEGLKFLGKLGLWLDLASVLKFNVDFQYEKYEALEAKFRENGGSYWEEIYNKLKENTSDVMD